jgi:hypothetical protein
MTARKLDKSQWRTFSIVSRKRSKESRPRSRLPRYPLAIRSRRVVALARHYPGIGITTIIPTSWLWPVSGRDKNPVVEILSLAGSE